MSMLMIMTLLTSLIFIQLNNPLSMGLILFSQTILICMMTGTLSNTFWFSYILFLVFLGGMLILFMYIISLASNEMFQMISKRTIFLMTMILSTIILFKKENMFNNLMNSDMMTMKMNQMMSNETITYLMKMYNFPTNTINILLMVYLLITLIVSVKITKINQGPMRKLN